MPPTAPYHGEHGYRAKSVPVVAYTPPGDDKAKAVAAASPAAPAAAPAAAVPASSASLPANIPASLSASASPAAPPAAPKAPAPAANPYHRTCPFETALMNSRRRIPYSLGASPPSLPAAARVKERLTPDEDDRLTRAMEAVYQDLLPSAESVDRRKQFVRKLERLLNDEWPNRGIRVFPFGSTENLLFSADSDVDLCITTPWKELENVCMLARFWAKHKMERIVCVPGAKVPIVKIWDPEFEIACDMNVNNTLALENTRMIKTYVQVDARVRPFAMVIKRWAKQRMLNDAAGGGTLSSYSWICLIISFLQLRKTPVLPVLHQLDHAAREVNGVDVSFCDDLGAVAGFGQANTESLGALLFAFFRWYTFEFEYDTKVVSIRHGRLLSKTEKGWHFMQNNRFCIEEPLVTSRNLGNTVDDISAKGIQLEFRRAFDKLARDGDLDACLAKYEF
ncbi:uncharacterized protein V1510DRAFT_359713, partial [Dipodascopsis tothii]|uniref:uncharacterized protein n=1 Tax=Dipodascopsis tothii TaxID=44089 RepID=UPI0034CE607D